MNFRDTAKISLDELILSLLLVIVLIFIPAAYLPLLPLSVILVLLLILYKEKFVIIFTIITFLAATATISPVLRNLVQLTNIALLGFYFFKHHGLNIKQFPSIPLPLLLFVTALLGIMVLSSFNSNLLLGLEQTIRLTVFLIIIYFYYDLIKHDKDSFKLILKSFYVISLIYSGYLLYEFAESNFSIIKYSLDQAAKLGNVYLSKNFIGVFFSVILTLSFSYFFYFKEGKQRYWFLFIIVLSVLSLVLLNSRISIITPLIGFIYIIYFFKKSLIKPLLLSLFFLAMLLLIRPIYELFELYFRIEKMSTGRDYILTAVFNVIKDNLFLGAGPAGTKYELYRNLPFMLGSPIEQFIRFHYNEIEFGHAHNFYLFFFSDLGIIGFILSLLLPFLFFKIGNGAAKNIMKNSFEYHTVIGIMACGLCLFLRGIFEWGGLISYGTINSDLPFWLLFSILIYFYQSNKEKLSRI